MKNKQRLKMCRQQRQGLATTLIDCQRENKNMQDKIDELERMVKVLEVENYKLFCANYNREVGSALGSLRNLNIEPPLEPLPIRPWWKVFF